MKRLLIGALLAAAGFVSAQVSVLDPSQTYSTGNLVNNTTSPNNTTGLWQNVGSWNQGLPCWSPQDSMYGAYCGPAPYFNNGSFNFSYGVTDVHQYVNIANALPSSGTGLRVNGYNFGFTAKNGNGWDGAGVDTLSAYVNFYGSDGKTVRSDYYNLNYQFDWTAFNFSKTFDSPYASKDLSTVRYGFVGGDTSNYWAGPYGPEIINVNFSLNYSVDPCATNPLYSPTCPGYMDALNKLMPSTTTTEPAAVTSTPNSDPVAASTQPSVVAPIVSAPAPSTTTSSTTSSTNTTASSSTATKENTGGSTAQAMSIISRNQDRDNQALSVAQTAMSSAAAAAAAAQQEAATVAAAAVANSTNNNAAANVNLSNTSAGTRSTAVNNTVTQTSMFQLMPGASTISANAPQSQNIGTNVTGSVNTMDTAPVAQTQPLAVTGTGSNTVETNVALSSNFLTDRANPINTVLEQKLPMPSAPTASTTGPSVNTRVADNEAASGVSIATMAVAPAGYGDYLNFTLRDAAFYSPREVYRNQRNVDNQRALRQLTNDSRHREMVEQQYRR